MTVVLSFFFFFCLCGVGDNPWMWVKLGFGTTVILLALVLILMTAIFISLMCRREKRKDSKGRQETIELKTIERGDKVAEDVEIG